MVLVVDNRMREGKPRIYSNQLVFLLYGTRCGAPGIVETRYSSYKLNLDITESKYGMLSVVVPNRAWNWWNNLHIWTYSVWYHCLSKMQRASYFFSKLPLLGYQTTAKSSFRIAPINPLFIAWTIFSMKWLVMGFWRSNSQISIWWACWEEGKHKGDLFACKFCFPNSCRCQSTTDSE